MAAPPPPVSGTVASLGCYNKHLLPSSYRLLPANPEMAGNGPEVMTEHSRTATPNDHKPACHHPA